MTDTADDETFYWCRKHGRVEPGDARCGAVHVLGPFATAADARDHERITETRTEEWDDADEAWDDWGTKDS